MEHQIRKSDGDKDTQFINRHYHARKSVLQRFVTTEIQHPGIRESTSINRFATVL